MRRTIAAEWLLELPAEEPEPASTRITDALAFACVPLSALAVPGAQLPINEVAMAGIVVLAAARTGRGRHRRPLWFPAVVLTVPLLVLGSSLANEVNAVKRLTHLLLWALLALFLSSGRIHLPSAARGLCLGLMASTAAFFSGIGAEGYTGRLTGWFGDPNNAGFYLTVCGFVVSAMLVRRAARLLWFGFLVATVVATASRTTLLAFALAVAWVLLAPRLGATLAALLGVGAVVGVSRLPRDLFGSAYAERTGSDLLRERILALEEYKVAQHPWFGGGGGTATVKVGQLDFFFHSGYLAVRQEGGWVTLTAVLLLVTAVLLTSAALPRARLPWAEGALIAVLVNAINLGEVFFELPTAIALGAVMWCWRVAREPGSPPGWPGALAPPGQAPARPVTDQAGMPPQPAPRLSPN